MTLIFMFFALLAGVIVTFQIGINSQLQLFLNNPVQAALVSFSVGTISLLLYSVIAGYDWPTLQEALQTPWWIWIGGVLGAIYVFSTIFLAPKLGATVLISLIITGQLITSLILDHYGFLGFPQQAINPWRILGVILLIIGAVLIRSN
ncbi:DMT family transporter [Acetohalobium arabaticum]|uniref:DMT family transporter n=1 Tax=Acetohalobium arabaticum (strain ATCC 49924 / DSM 5501 / Z-7288) TaxID=574087 RepID=D9QQD5_ACEAZ|nr:DMT family transporter [Acetohalobium arabaticum]ADL12726.1 protein of unknown function DUF606 [Acetohalobium arabaticum DSM 5501]